MYFENRFKIDWWCLELLDKMQNKFFDLLAFIVSYLGTGIFLFGFLLAIFYLVDKEKAKKIGLITCISLLFNNFLKNLFQAKRPFEFEQGKHLRKLTESLDGATGTSFPSGHVQNLTALATITSLTFKKKWITITSIILIILVAISRLYLGVHFPGDVVIGIFLGFSITVLAYYLYERSTKWYHKYFLTLASIIMVIPTLILQINNPVSADIFKSFGFALGFTISMIIDEKYLHYNQEISFKNKLIHFIIALSAAGILYLTKLVLPSGNLFGLFRYMLVSLGGFLIVPLIAKKKVQHE